MTSSASTSTGRKCMPSGRVSRRLRARLRRAPQADTRIRPIAVQLRVRRRGRRPGALPVRRDPSEARRVRRRHAVRRGRDGLADRRPRGRRTRRGKSTVPVGTAARLAQLVTDKVPGALLAWNPEFLREGFAVEDTLHPDRLVYGLPPGDEGVIARALLDDVYAPIVARGTPKVESDYATAEMVKTAANSFLATKISFINAIAELCEATGADV